MIFQLLIIWGYHIPTGNMIRRKKERKKERKNQVGGKKSEIRSKKERKKERKKLDFKKSSWQ